MSNSQLPAPGNIFKPRGTFVNTDAWCFWNTDDLSRMNGQGVADDVDFYLQNGGVEALVFNMNFQRTFFPSATWTEYDHDVELASDGSLLVRGKRVTSPGGAVVHGEETYIRMFSAYREMKRNCPDFMKVRYDYCHKRGVELWHSMRVNDVHWTSPGLEERPQHSDFWYGNAPEFSRAWYRRPWFKEWNWENYALDYGRKEVYDYNLSLVREYMLGFPCDGFELDWLRSLPVFRPGYDESNASILTRFMRDVKEVSREASMKWGHAIRIGVRVPTRPQEALDYGMDVGKWAEEGLVDLVVPSPASVRVEQDTQVGLWRRLLPRNVILAPAVDMYASSGWMQRTRIAIDCAFASDFYREGADTIYTFNHFRSFTNVMPEIPEWIGIAANRDEVSRRERRHVVSWRECKVDGQNAECPYPALIAPGSAGAIRINLGEKTDGRKARFVIGLMKKLKLELWLNTVRMGELVELDHSPADYPRGTDDTPVFYYGLELADGVCHDGWNVIDLVNHGDENLLSSEYVWTEIRIAAASLHEGAVVESRAEFRNRKILVDGMPIRLLAGTMHYFRVPRSCWRDRMEKGRELGLNAIETYMCWNLHERREGEFDFTDNLDFEEYCREAQRLGMYVVLRPGPYICSEWDNGGIPSWLMSKSGVRFRRMNPAFISAVDRYFAELLPRIKALDVDHGGPIMAIQLENEYGSYAGDKAYIAHLRDLYRNAGIMAPLFTADGAEAPNLPGHVGQLCTSAGCLDGIAMCYNFGNNAKETIDYQKRLRPDEPFVCTEFWIGWFDNWGGKHGGRDTESVCKELDDILAADGHVIFYALCGGTDFYWTNGANGMAGQSYRPMTTSYDFDALLTEDGRYTAKFFEVKKVLDKWRALDGLPPNDFKPLAPLPGAAKGFAFEADVELKGSLKLVDCLDAVASKKVCDNSPLSFEELGTDFGFVFYKTRIPASLADPIKAGFVLMNVRDRAQMFIDGRKHFTYYRNDESPIAPDAEIPKEGAELTLLVENTGRINFSNMTGLDTKGICQDVRFAHLILTGWEMWALPLDNPDGKIAFAAPDQASDSPAFHLYEFECEIPSDSFLKFPGIHGLTWLNGKPLGRYWNIGPGDALYVPASMLKKGNNRLIVFETDALVSNKATFTCERNW